MNWSVISAVNSNEVLERCLLSSPEIQFAKEVILQRGYASAAAAYNAAIEKATADRLVLVHQDVYLPEGWLMTAQNEVDIVSKTDPDWGVLGCWGIRPSGERVGFLYDGAWRKVRGNYFEGGLEVESLDEVVLILRKSSGLRFDPRLAGFHMYGADICLEARSRQKKCYAISAFCIHNTNQYGMLPWQFWKAYLAMRQKWRDHLPIRTSCTEITRWCWPMLRWNLVRAINLATGRDERPAKRVQDPSVLFRELVCSGTVQPLVPLPRHDVVKRTFA